MEMDLTSRFQIPDDVACNSIGANALEKESVSSSHHLLGKY